MADEKTDRRRYEEAMELVEALLNDEEFMERMREIRRKMIKRKKL